MPMKKGQRLGGVYETEDLRLRSHVDADCGCWRWRLRCNPSGTAMVAMIVDGKKRDLNGRRAALLLAGFKPKPGDEAIQLATCVYADCVNAAHSRFGTRGDRNRALGARGAWGEPRHYAKLAAHARSRRKLDEQQRLDVACSEEPGAVLAARHGVSESLIGQIRRSVRRTPVASVFEWRG